MMTAAATLCVVLLAGSVAGGKLSPRLIPNEEQLVFKTGDDFDLLCESRNPIGWSYPYYGITTRPTEVSITYREVEGAEHRHVSILKVRGATFTGTGFYFCTEEGEFDLENPDGVSRVYVYVFDPTNLLVRDDMIMYGYEGGQVTLPCRPTSPDVRVIVRNDDGQDMLEDPRVTYSPKVGFTIASITRNDSRSYNCEAKFGDDNVATRPFLIRVLPATDLPPTLKVTLVTSYPVVEGATFTLNCSATLNTNDTFFLKWNTPTGRAQPSQRLEVGSTTRVLAMQEGRAVKKGYNVLSVHNASRADNGLYSCVLTAEPFYQRSQDFNVVVLKP